MRKVSILGAGSWGTALAVILAKKGVEVNLWCRNETQASQLNKIRENIKYLPGVLLPQNIKVFSDLKEAVYSIECVVMSIPSHGIREVLQNLSPLLNSSAIIVNTAKGIEPQTLMRLSQVFNEELPGINERFCVLSGPTHAEEVSRDMPSAAVAASEKDK